MFIKLGMRFHTDSMAAHGAGACGSGGGLGLGGGTRGGGGNGLGGGTPGGNGLGGGSGGDPGGGAGGGLGGGSGGGDLHASVRWAPQSPSAPMEQSATDPSSLDA